MDPKALEGITVKSRDEIIDQLVKIVHQHRRRFLRKHMRPCPENCAQATVTRRGVTGCPGCSSTNPEACRQTAHFVAIESKEDVDQAFRDTMHDLNILRHDYRDIVTLLWVLGLLDGEEPELDQLMRHVEARQQQKGNTNAS